MLSRRTAAFDAMSMKVSARLGSSISSSVLLSRQTLSPGLQRQLRKILKSNTWLRADNGPGILAAMPDALSFVLRIESPG